MLTGKNPKRERGLISWTNFIWPCPKTTFISKRNITAIVGEGISVYKKWYLLAISNLLKQFGLPSGANTASHSRKRNSHMPTHQKVQSSGKYKKYRNLLQYAKLKEHELRKTREGKTHEHGFFRSSTDCDSLYYVNKSLSFICQKFLVSMFCLTNVLLVKLCYIYLLLIYLTKTCINSKRNNIFLTFTGRYRVYNIDRVSLFEPPCLFLASRT